MKNVAWAVVGAAVGAGLMWLALEGEEPSGCATNQDLVDVSLVNGSPTAKPDPSCVDYPDASAKGGSLTWWATGTAGDIVMMKFNDGVGPFENSPRDGYVITIGPNGQGGPLTTGKAIVRPAGGSYEQDWPYTITWNSGGAPPATVDPMVRIRGGPP